MLADPAYNADPSHEWYFERTNTVHPAGDNRIRSASTSMYFDISCASKAERGRSHSVHDTGGSNLRWVMFEAIRGEYDIMNVNSGMSLTTRNRSLGSQIVQHDDGGRYTDHEMFELTLAP